MLFFFNDTATTEIYTLSLHDALPIYAAAVSYVQLRVGADRAVYGVGMDSNIVTATLLAVVSAVNRAIAREWLALPIAVDRKSTRLNSSHSQISYALFCLKIKKSRRTR